MWIFVLIYTFLFVPYWALIAWYHRTWKAIPPFRPEIGSPSSTRISVLVPARNEEANIGACIDSLLEQSYPKAQFEVIVIDDDSTDRTWEIVSDGRYAYRQIKAAQLPKPGPGTLPTGAHKKKAIETGISLATGELIVTTDADCRFHPDWLSTIAAFYDATGARFIAAPVRIGQDSPTASEKLSSPLRQHSQHPSLLAIFQTLDFITLQGITGAAVYKNFHSMCNGANLAYTKETFYEVEGFRGIDDIASGDDMLLMYKIYKRHPGKIFFLKNSHAIVSTKEAADWHSFLNQRIRWASKADRYEDRRIFWALLLVYLVNISFLCLLAASFWDITRLWILLVLIILKTLIEFPLVRSSALFFGQQRLMAWFPLMQPLHILYTVIIGWLGKFGSYSWKDRKYAHPENDQTETITTYTKING
jgi:cellulose synthase/poly-beta-1,6-N-acetylglucosamine synthase-like glycosyltransferase